MDDTDNFSFGFWPLLIPLAASIATPLITNAIKKDKPSPQLNNGRPNSITDTITPIAQQLLPSLLPTEPINAPAAPFFPTDPINAPAAPFFPEPINVSAVPFFPPTPPKPTIGAIFNNLGTTGNNLPPVTMMTTNYSIRGTDNKLRQLKVTSRPLESGETIKVRITFYAATNRAGLSSCGLDTNSTNYLGAFGNKLVPYKSVAASIGNFTGRNSRFTVSPENHPIFKKFQKLRIPELAQIFKTKLGINHDGIFQIDDTGQDVVAQRSENGANPVIDVFLPDCMDIQKLQGTIRYATVTVI